MNKLNKKILNLYILSNKTKDFVNGKPSYQEVLYFAKHSEKNDLSALTNYVLQSGDFNFIIDYAMYAKNISLLDITRIVHTIISTGNAEYISRITRHINTLNSGHIDLLTAALIKTKNYSEMLRFYIEVEILGKDNKQLIFEEIVTSKNNRVITEFITRVSKLTEEEISKLINAIDSNNEFGYNKIIKSSKLSKQNKYELLLKVLDTNNIEYIFSFILSSEDAYNEYQNIIFDKFVQLENSRAIINYYCDVMDNSTYENRVVEIIRDANDAKLALYFLSKNNNTTDKNNLNILENIILNSNDKKIIAKYILLTTNNRLAKNIFGDLMYFYVFCKDVLKMDINIEGFKEMLEINANEEYTKYVDERLNKINIQKK